ncbi:MAG: ABC transporter permease [Firmicutes bacterium]|nr:ABC transporter permease [Bacillota bacterium]
MNLLAQIRQTFRSLFRSPGFTLPIVVVLGLGLGVNVALHAILQTVLLRPLPVQKPRELAFVKLASKGEPDLSALSYPQIQFLQERPGPIAALSPMVKDSDTTLNVQGRKLEVNAPMVGESWFALLGLKPSLGRFFTEEEERSGTPVAVLSHHLWKTAFQSDPTILGRTVTTADKKPSTFTVVGVGPEGFEGLEAGRREGLWLPLKALLTLAGDRLPKDLFTQQQFTMFGLVARLKPGATRQEAQAALDAASQVLSADKTVSFSGKRFALEGLEASEQKVMARVLPQQTLLLVASSLALLLAVVSASGLFAARAAQREKELATRAALGASGKELALPLLREALALAVLAAPVALSVGLALARRFMLRPSEAASTANLLPQINGPILFWGLGLSVMALLLAALLPLLKARRTDPLRALNAQGRGVSRTGGGQIFVVAQVALSLALLAASSVALKAFRGAARMGYPTNHRALLVVDTETDPNLPKRLVTRLREMPEIRSVARSAAAPLGGVRITVGLTAGEQTEMQHYPAAMVGADWFKTLGVPLLEGREFTDQDGQDKAILNETLARKLFPEGRAVGRKLSLGDGTEVIGVVADHRMRATPEYHLPMMWLTPEWVTINRYAVVADGKGSSRSLVAALKSALVQEAPRAEPLQLLTLDDYIADNLRQEHQNLRLLGLLGLGSLLLACFGLWAALNLHVALRHHELGIRAALGATARHLFARVMSLGFRMLGLGLLLGGLLVWLLARFASAHWTALPALAPLDIAFALGALVAAGLLACLLPALRAARVQPAEALRSE